MREEGVVKVSLMCLMKKMNAWYKREKNLFRIKGTFVQKISIFLK